MSRLVWVGGESYLVEADVLRLFPEALTAEIQSVLPDETGPVLADAAGWELVIVLIFDVELPLVQRHRRGDVLPHGQSPPRPASLLLTTRISHSEVPLPIECRRRSRSRRDRKEG